ncbi:MAG TPA: CocE/NonD family hydrolase [Gemmatimonadaceae bacterium]|nr:CocE/NonD family hydrolase [Gemmatimonadaceae bacterium]
MRRLVIVLGASLIGASHAAAQAMETDVAVPMRDGVVLRAIVLKPNATGRFPTLVYRTPYGASEAITDYATFTRAVERGYAVVVQDVRGRYQSAGEFNPYRQEGKDGYDTIEWAASQPWSTGDVGTFGLSYPGAVQWLAAVESPPHLKAMVPAMTFSRPDNFWYAGGLPDLSWPAWIWFNIAPDVRQRRKLTGPQTYEEARSAWRQIEGDLLKRLPITNVPELAGVAPWYLEWLAHPPNDPWWNWSDLRGRYAKTSAAVLNISGWHDENYGPEGALTNHLGIVRARSRERDARSYLILGPWVHGANAIDNRRATAKSGERSFDGKGGLDYTEEILRFMDRYVRGMNNGVDRSPRVRAFVMGENVWRTGNTWPLPGTTRRTFSLGRSREGRGVLAPSWETAGSWTIQSDPDNPVVDQYDAAYGAHDYRALAQRADVMVFETAPLQQDMRVLGEIRVQLSVSVDAPDADIFARIFDVAPDGTAWNLMSPGLEVQRLSARPNAKPLVPNEPTMVTFGNHLTGNLFRRGHRLRLVILPSFHPHFSRNLHTGRRETDSAERRKARITLHYGPAHPSTIELPVLR